MSASFARRLLDGPCGRTPVKRTREVTEANRTTELGLLKVVESNARKALCDASSGCRECARLRKALHALDLLRIQKQRKART